MIHGIIAVGPRGEIGLNGGLPWPSIPEDMKRFRELTIGGTVLMGRRTYDSLPAQFRPLPKRRNIVITTKPESIDVSVGDVIAASGIHVEDAFVIGGALIYEQSASSIGVWHVTRVSGSFEADTFFVPDLVGFSLAEWEQLASNAKYERWVRG